MDLGIGFQMIEKILWMLVFFSYLIEHEFDLVLFLQGTFVAFFYFIGMILSNICHDTGPGGPISALI